MSAPLPPRVRDAVRDARDALVGLLADRPGAPGRGCWCPNGGTPGGHYKTCVRASEAVGTLTAMLGTECGRCGGSREVAVPCPSVNTAKRMGFPGSRVACSVLHTGPCPECVSDHGGRARSAPSETPVQTILAEFLWVSSQDLYGRAEALSHEQVWRLVSAFTNARVRALALLSYQAVPPRDRSLREVIDAITPEDARKHVSAGILRPDLLTQGAN